MAAFGLTAPARTLFGRGTRHEAVAEVARLGRRVLLVRGGAVPWVDTFEAELRAAGLALTTLRSAGEPTIDQLRAGLAEARDFGADCVVAVGGGATLDLGKALAGLLPSEGDPQDYLELGGNPARRLEEPLPFAALPTTAGTGAEATRNAVIGLPEAQLKISLRDPRLVPDLALVDPALTDGAPLGLTLASGLDAITQLIESYLTPRANTVTDALCRDALPGAIAALKRLTEAEDEMARDRLARASHLSGLALANAGLGVVHGLASVIGARGGAHGAICGRLLAPSLTVNAAALRRAGAGLTRLAQVDGWLATGLGAPGTPGVAALRQFLTAQSFPSLAQLGLPRTAHAETAEQARGASSTQANPVVLSAAEIVEILETAD